MCFRVGVSQTYSLLDQLHDDLMLRILSPVTIKKLKFYPTSAIAELSGGHNRFMQSAVLAGAYQAYLATGACRVATR